MTSPLLPVHILFVAALAATVPAQSLVDTVVGTVPGGELGSVLRAVGDLDGDGITDFAASEPGNGGQAGRVRVHSGRTRALLRTFTGSMANGMASLGEHDICPVGDVDGDGTPDLAIGYQNRGALDVFSGRAGTRLYRLGTAIEFLPYACSVGDRDGDGRDDFAALVGINSTLQIWLVKGNTGTQLATVDTQPGDGFLRDVGDLNGDGVSEFVRIGWGTCDVYRTNPPARLRRITVPGPDTFDFADWNGDGRLDLVVQDDLRGVPSVFVFDLGTGQQQRSYTFGGLLANSTVQAVVVLGDVDLDGTPDFAVRVQADPIHPGTNHLAIISGASGARIGNWPGVAGSAPSSILAGIGDVDGDGYPEFAMAQPFAQDRAGMVQVISTKTFAAMVEKPVNCYTGPFPPELGMSRPVLGGNCTIAGRDAPAGAPSLLVFSPLPTGVASLGVPGCDVWFDLGRGTLLAQPTTVPTWSLTVPIPNVRQLLGFEFALQAFYVGTNTPVGLDMTNGLWARLGN